jgi:excisionase family DNA binding protein
VAIDKVQTYNQPISQKIVDVNSKDFLTIKEVAILLSCSIRTVYYYIENGSIQDTNLGIRLTRVKRSDVDKLFIENIEIKVQEKIELERFDISEYYTISEI